MKRFIYTYLCVLCGLVSWLGAYELDMSDDICCRPKKHLELSYLFWKPTQNDMIYAVQIPGGIPNEGLPFADKLFFRDQQFEAGSGFRLFAEYEICDNIDAGIAWTRLHHTTPGCSIADGTFDILATGLLGFVDANIVSGARASWCVAFDTVDLEFAYPFNLCDCLTVRPRGGITWAGIKQLQAIRYEGLINDPALNIDFNRRSTFSGAGPRLGIDLYLHMCQHVYLMGVVSGVLVYGPSKATSQYIGESNGEPFHPAFILCQHYVRPAVQFLIGVGGEREWCGVPVTLNLAYEAQYWWAQWTTVGSSGAALAGVLAKGDLAFHGLTITTGVRF